MKLMKKVLPVILAGAMVFGTVATGYAAEDAWSIADATKTEVSYKIDGETVKATWYVDNYLKETGDLSDADYANAKVNVYVPEGADENSPILYMVDNSGWRSNGYSDVLISGEIADSSKDGKENFAAKALKEGFVVVNAGLRTRGTPDAAGNVNHSPVTVADAKAVIMYLKHNDGIVGDTDRIFITGTSGGGALSVAIGSDGNSADFKAELEAIGACMEETNDIFGLVAYCPITDLGHSDMSYEFTYAGTRADLKASGYTTTDVQEGMPARGQYSLCDQSMTLSPILAAEYVDYVNGLGISGATAAFDAATLTASGGLADTMKELVIAELQEALDELGADAFFAKLETREADSTQYDNGTPNEGWKTDWVVLSDDKKEVKDIDVDGYLYYVALGQLLKPAPAFTNDGLGLGGVFFNENNLFGQDDEAHGYISECVFDLSDMKAAYGTWEAYQAANKDLVAKQSDMVDSIHYLASDDGDSAPYWYVRHGLNDRDTGFMNQTLLYLAMEDDSTIETKDFEFVWGRGHEGAYEIDEAFAFMAAALEDADDGTTDDGTTDDGNTDDGNTDDGNKDDETTDDGDKEDDDDKKSPSTSDNFGFLAVAVVAAAGLAFVARRRVVR